MQTGPYWRMVFRLARRETFSHAQNKIILGLVIAMLATLLQYLLKIRSLNDSEKIALRLFGSYGVVMGGSFLWSLIRTPAALHLNRKQRAPREQHYFDLAQAALKNRGEQAVIALRHLRLSGTITSGKNVGASLPAGIDPFEFRTTLNQLAADGVISEEQSWPMGNRIPSGYDVPANGMDDTIRHGVCIG
jgi:hypothetical protein